MTLRLKARGAYLENSQLTVNSANCAGRHELHDTLTFLLGRRQRPSQRASTAATAVLLRGTRSSSLNAVRSWPLMAVPSGTMAAAAVTMPSATRIFCARDP